MEDLLETYMPNFHTNINGRAPEGFEVLAGDFVGK